VGSFYPAQFFRIFAGGFVGVELFFVLSGFLITSLLIDEHRRSGGIGIGRFYQRRALRLLPAVAVLIAVHAMYSKVTHGDARAERNSIVAALLYVTNWFQASGVRVTPGLVHLWSLAVEEQFYVIWPLITAVLLMRPAWRRAAPALIGAGVVGLAVWTAILWGRGYNFFNIYGIYMRTEVQAVGLLVGAGTAYLWTSGTRLPRHLGPLAMIGAGVILLCSWRYQPSDALYYEKFGLTWLAVAGAVVIVAVVEGKSMLAPALAWLPLRSIGRVSYGLYLWHLPVFVAVHEKAGNWPAAVQLSVALALTTICTLVSWRFVETPFLRRKARLARARIASNDGAADVYSLAPPAALDGTTASGEPA
jgi:peptidoglycan/LPS O-acetylase OafA/YrhL